MQVDWTLLVMIVFPIWAALDFFLGRRPKIMAYLGQPSSFSLEGENSAQVRTHAVILANVGRKEATNIRLGHKILPDFKFLFPRQAEAPASLFEVTALPGKDKEIVIPLLAPAQQVTISYMYAPTLSLREINTYVKSDAGSAELHNILPLSPYPAWLSFLGVQLLEIIPIAILVYWAIARVRS